MDEYENMDDVGYMRKDVPSQQRFVELELDLGSEDGSERYFMHQPGDMAYEDSLDSSETDDGDEVDVVPYPGTATTEENSEPVLDFAVPGSPTSKGHDEIWELGPQDIKFAEPVTTPSKKVEKEEEAKPVLSRVESLSSSFVDFELERLDDEQLSGKSDHTCDNEVIDFVPSTEGYSGVSTEDIEQHRSKASMPVFSTTSSLEVRMDSSVSTSSEMSAPAKFSSLKVKAERCPSGVAEGEE